MQMEKEKWWYVLKSVLHAILFCAKNNLPLRGHSNTLGDPSSGIFLHLIEIISHRDRTLAQYLSSSGHLKYLSWKIQNEFIELLGNHLR